MSDTTFGEVIKEARKNKKYSLRKFGELVGIDFNYLCRVENNKIDYPLKEEAIRRIACKLDLDAEKMIFLAGRLPSEYQKVIQANYQAMPVLFRQMREKSLTIKEQT